MRVEHLLAQSIAKDLGTAPDDIRPTLLAASTAAALSKVAERLPPETGTAIPYEDALAMLEQMFNLLRRGLNELAAPHQRDHPRRPRKRR
jgi:hypothetical protein